MKRLIAIPFLFALCTVAAVHKPAAVHQGRGAEDLIAKHKAVTSMASMMPNIVIGPPKPVTFFFTATAYNWLIFNGTTWTVNESDPSTSISFVRTNSTKTVTLAWDYEIADGYKIQFGRVSNQLTNIVDVGNVTNATVQIVPPTLTNMVVTVTGSTNWTMTNPPSSSMFFTGQNLTISKRYF